MGKIVKLVKLVEHLAELDGEDTIYACEPWTEDSDAMVAREDPDQKPFGIPLEAAEAGMMYFLEVDIARDEVLEGWIASLNEKPTLAAICQRLIEYAINDA
jgi:hypothetical protein